MMTKTLGIGFMTLALLTAGCAAKLPQPIAEPSGSFAFAAATASDIRQAILRAVAGTPWQIEDASDPGEIVVKLVRANSERMVKAKILYTAASYRICFVDAADMDYDPKERTISRKYNQWIRNLEKQIRLSLTTPAR